MIGTCSEWLLAVCFQLYILSFAIELRHAYCHAPKLRLTTVYDGSASDSTISVRSGNVVGCCGGVERASVYGSQSPAYFVTDDKDNTNIVITVGTRQTP
jgi:hypothetical protein